MPDQPQPAPDPSAPAEAAPLSLETLENDKKVRSRAWFAALACFLLAALVSNWLVDASSRRELAGYRLSVAAALADQAHFLGSRIERELSAVYAVSALLAAEPENPASFALLGEKILPLYTNVSALALLPAKGVTQVVADPLQTQSGELALIDALAATRSPATGLTLGEPVQLESGRLVVLASLPILPPLAEAGTPPWAWVVVSIHLSDLLESTRLHLLHEHGLGYQLLRPDATGDGREVITGSETLALVDPVTRPLDLPGVNWELALAPIDGWDRNASNMAGLVLGLLVSGLLAYLAKLLVVQQHFREQLARTVSERTAELMRAQTLAKVGAWQFDPSRQSFSATAVAGELFELQQGAGISAEEVLARSHPEDRRALREAWQAAMDGGAFDIEHRVLCANGQTRWLHSRAEVLFDQMRRPARILGTSQDITRSKFAETRLERERMFLHQLLRNIPDMIWLKDLDGRYMACNTRFEAFFGASETEIIGRTDYDFVDRELAEFFLANDKQALQSRQAHVNEERVILASTGEQCLLETIKTPMYGPQGEVLGVLGIGRDITARKNAEDLLVRERQRFVDLVNTTDGIVWEARASDFCFTFVSEKAVRLLGYPQQDWYRPGFWSEHLHPEDRQWAPDHCRHCSDAGQAHSVEYRLIASDGRTIWLRDEVIVVDQDGSRWLRGIMVDITAAKRTERALRESEERYRSLVSALSEGVVLQNARGRILTCNNAARQLLGIGEDTATRTIALHADWQLLDAQGAPLADQDHPATRALQTGRSHHHVVVGVRKPDGELHWLLANAEPLHEPSGKTPYGVVTSYQDITSQRLLEAEVREERQRLQEIIRGTHVGTWEWNVATGETRFNELWAEIVGYSLVELEPISIDTWMALAHPDDLLESERQLQRVFNGETEFYEFECRMRHKNGEWVWVLDRGKVFEWSADGRPLRLAGTHQDITERKRHEQRLQESERRYRSLAESIPGMVYRLRPDWSVELTTNSELISGHPGGAFIGGGRDWLDLVHPADADSVIDQARALQQQATSLVQEYRIAHRDGSTRWVRDHKASRFEDGVFLGCDGIIFDVTDRKRIEAELARERDLFSRGPVVSVVWMAQTGSPVRYVSPNLREVLGYTPQEWLQPGFNYESLVHPEDLSRVREELTRNLESGTDIFEQAYRLRHRDGRYVDLYDFSRVERDAEGRVVEIRGYFYDQTERRRAEAGMRESAVVFEASSQGIMITDAAKQILMVNPEFTRITGYPPEEVIGRTPALLRSGRHDALFYRQMWNALQTSGRWEGEIFNRRKSGEVYPQWLSISAVRDINNKVLKYVALINDITERKRQEAIVWRQANFDALTGLANRSLLLDRLDRAISNARRSGRKIGVMLLDLDGFKIINDSLGHKAGDDLLIEVAARLQGCIREQDTAARLGGDEFTLVLHDIAQIHNLDSVADKVLVALRQPFSISGGTHFISASIGITVFPDHGQDVQSLIRQADIAMYAAKYSGKNRVCHYEPGMQASTDAKIQIEAELRKAIERREFELHYQPIVDADSGEVISVEALIRWNHPDKGLLPPSEFIPVAEQTGLIVDLGEWLLREAVAAWRNWRRQGIAPAQIAVNMSAKQFQEPDLPALLARIQSDNELPPGVLQLEVTETLLMESSASLSARLRELKALGLSYALDDFGTGYSSLSYLKHYPFDKVKIDRDFIRHCTEEQNEAHLVEAIINMAHSMDLEVTAEGVETPAQLAFLRDLGCDHAQGYLISKPLPDSELAVLLARRHLLPLIDGRSTQVHRIFAALRRGDTDIDAQIENLFSGRDDVEPFRSRDPRSGPDWQVLHQGIQAHLTWRNRFIQAFEFEPDVTPPLDPSFVQSASNCVLGQWISEQARGTTVSKDLARLDGAHRDLHDLAASIILQHNRGNIEGALRSLRGLKFRLSTRNLVRALVHYFESISESVEEEV